MSVPLANDFAEFFEEIGAVLVEVSHAPMRFFMTPAAQCDQVGQRIWASCCFRDQVVNLEVPALLIPG